MGTKPLTDSEFIETVALIASNYGCIIEDIDLDKWIISITGPNELECSVAIGEYLEKNYGITEVDPIKQDITFVKDGIGWAP